MLSESEVEKSHFWGLTPLAVRRYALPPLYTLYSTLYSTVRHILPAIPHILLLPKPILYTIYYLYAIYYLYTIYD